MKRKNNSHKSILSTTLTIIAWVSLAFCLSVALLGGADNYELVNGDVVNTGRDWLGTITWCAFGVLSFVGFRALSKLTKAAQIKIDEARLKDIQNEPNHN